MAPDWAPSFEAVPRAGFLPDLMWPHDMATGRNLVVDRLADPEAWQRHADSDDPIVTQWDDGRHDGREPGKAFSSSSSMPSLVFAMLSDLDVRPGQRVLEIGSGTGWNAALLAHRLGAANVVTVEVDGTVAAQAQESLARFGLPVEVVHADGFLGCTKKAPYDRIIATCGLREIPFAWVEQSNPGGVILVPWGTYYGPGEATARLVVADDRRSATGPFTRPVAFMRMRSQRFVWPRHDAYVAAGAMDAAETSTTPVTEAELCGTGGTGAFDPVTFALGLRVPDVAHLADRKRDGKRAVWFYGLSDMSWAVVVFRDDDRTEATAATEAKVYQSGPRRLWEEVEAAYRWWVERGRPGFERFGLTVDRDGAHPWLDTPNELVRAMSPGSGAA
ncbi:methyltransferase domain-containing protein [Streptomyces sp. S186]|uniref:methyltransferase domain-containing protein n=1 Tax=Streptomyces sp. S186 TaxID=3434395 RepID=UPI003F6708BA